MKAILYYVHDPMCSWCWGFSRTLKELLEHLPKEIEVRRLLGGLASDSDIPMPQATQESIKNNWLRIEDSIHGVKFNFDFWDNTIPRRSTFPACRAVIAARNQGMENDEKMTAAIQRAYYQEARNPSDNSTLIELAGELNLSTSIFEKSLMSDEVAKEFINEISLSRELYAESYPSLVLVMGEESFPIKIDYNDSDIIKEQIEKHLQSK